MSSYNSFGDDNVVTISHCNSDAAAGESGDLVTPCHAPVTQDVTNGPGLAPAPGSYVTSVTVSSMCLCCTGQQARRCSVNIGESHLKRASLLG